MTDPAIQLAETIQTASINPHPSAAHDINPSTTTSQKEPVTIRTYHHRSPSYATSISTDIVDPSRSIRPLQRAPLPPLPDLRFEQSYLASLKGAETWQRVAWITLRDQVFLPLLQGTLWTLALTGWRYWNRGAQFTGQTLGTRIRRWWWEVNNWKIPQS
ncbi:hypothetical protein RJZ56_004506 [Blastomyces dermatitidis]|uniref:DUF1770 domain-containing protein n=3 Tax=Blastomyces TaxID=229219 RepID=A0A179UIM2_BLAGS|nr:uncharacterized protein BDBG_03653 [Blastomyces gilchristii SLH14081]XP_045274516.1 uncharacterized protein BDCG_02240 [Blastomyces dermatitidis ER-3]EGE86090.1 hypothetical protein BDDG_09035 [Blastomyces dermatitidis ATCC 18188]EQL31978.1 hypothetical protein BDFG_05774 [Blastomyces dermatitidis ATCC 26199]EEQ87120.1 hypothetical protein BDCG_02240 [Blastomyces dermatitidis ER-3]OAT07613.1 hypothetical protein BDBG_03653 [Blastomyces gilchristii SLH14081]